jgi:predicted nuclease with TOPRIM domain
MSCETCHNTSGHTSSCPWLLEEVQTENDELRARVTKLEQRQQELLATIVRVTNETPFPDEIKGWQDQRAKMIAEVGSFKSRCAELERDLALQTFATGEVAMELERQMGKVEKMLPVYQAALLWRRELIGERASYDLRLEAAVDTATKEGP